VRSRQPSRCEELERLNDELERGLGVRLEVRLGANNGEVVAGDHAARQRLVTGDAVNVAKRLEQAAGSGEILIGRETQRLVRDAVRVEEVARSRSRASNSRCLRSGCSRSSQELRGTCDGWTRR
jgi:class 3 adenylate cyclase